MLTLLICILSMHMAPTQWSGVTFPIDGSDSHQWIFQMLLLCITINSLLPADQHLAFVGPRGRVQMEVTYLMST